MDDKNSGDCYQVHPAGDTSCKKNHPNADVQAPASGVGKEMKAITEEDAADEERSETDGMVGASDVKPGAPAPKPAGPGPKTSKPGGRKASQGERKPDGIVTDPGFRPDDPMTPPPLPGKGMDGVMTRPRK